MSTNSTMCCVKFSANAAERLYLQLIDEAYMILNLSPFCSRSAVWCKYFSVHSPALNTLQSNTHVTNLWKCNIPIWNTNIITTIKNDENYNVWCLVYFLRRCVNIVHIHSTMQVFYVRSMYRCSSLNTLTWLLRKHICVAEFTEQPHPSVLRLWLVHEGHMKNVRESRWRIMDSWVIRRYVAQVYLWMYCN